jgi:hypothetical protein
MSTSEITAYLWGYSQAAKLHEVTTGGRSVKAWLAEPSDMEYEASMMALGPETFIYWCTRGSDDWVSAHWEGKA